MVAGIPTRQAILRLAKGGVELTDLENLVVLHGQTGAASKFSTLRKDFGSAGYAVTTGKTLYILAAKLVLLNAAPSASAGLGIGYGDTDVGMGAGAAPTTPKYLANQNPFWVINGLTPTDTNGVEAPLFMPIPAGKYVFMGTDAAATWGGYANLTLFGYER